MGREETNDRALTWVFWIGAVSALGSYLSQRSGLFSPQFLVTCFELSLELFAASLFLRSIITNWHKDNKNAAFVGFFSFVYALSFLISDFFFAREFYFSIPVGDAFSVYSITVPCAIGFFAQGSMLVYFLFPVFKELLLSKRLFVLFFALALTLAFSWVSFRLFVLNFESKYGELFSDHLDYIRLLSVLFGALSASFGLILCTISQRPELAFLGLGAVLQVLGDWSMRVKEYLNQDLFAAYGEYIFFLGLFYSLSAMLLLLLDHSSNDRTTKNAVPFNIGERQIILMPSLLLFHYSVLNYEKMTELLDWFLLTVALSLMCMFLLMLRSRRKQRLFVQFLLKRNELQVQKSIAAQMFPHELAEIYQILEGQAYESARQKAIVDSIRFVAHDLAHPFTALKHFILILQRKPRPQEIALQEMLGRLEKNFSKVDALLRDIVEVMSDKKISFSDVSICKVVEETIEDGFMSVHRFGVNKVKCSYKHSRMVRADHGKLKRVVYNLLQNAIQAIADRNRLGDLFISIDTSDQMRGGRRYVELRVTNNGSYIPAKLVSDAMNSRLPSRNSQARNGLGLAIAQKIMEAHHSEIQIESHYHEKEEQRYVAFSTFIAAAESAQDVGVKRERVHTLRPEGI